MRTFLLHIGGVQTQVIELKPGVNRLGRNPLNDFQIVDGTVSSYHCEIHASDTDVLVRDLGSTNGTFINGQPVKEAPLQAGQELRLGSVEMTLQIPPVHIALPSVTVEQAPGPSLLADGSEACLNHRDMRGVFRCAQCGRAFCRSCIHVLRRSGGKALVLCPSCSGHCEALPTAEATKKKRSFLVRLADTLKLVFQRDSNP